MGPVVATGRASLPSPRQRRSRQDLARIEPLNPHDPTALLHSAFYRFAHLPDPPAAAEALRALAQGLTGSIVLATEGINGTVAGPAHRVRAFEAALQADHFAAGALRGMPFKHSACDGAPFGRMKVSVKPEIVALGLPGSPDGRALALPDEHDPSHLSPPAWRALLARGDVVLLDNRNHFEFRLGRFAVRSIRRCTTFAISWPMCKPMRRPGAPPAGQWRCTAPAASAATRQPPGCAAWAWRCGSWAAAS